MFVLIYRHNVLPTNPWNTFKISFWYYSETGGQFLFYRFWHLEICAILYQKRIPRAKIMLSLYIVHNWSCFHSILCMLLFRLHCLYCTYIQIKHCKIAVLRDSFSKVNSRSSTYVMNYTLVHPCRLLGTPIGWVHFYDCKCQVNKDTKNEPWHWLDIQITISSGTVYADLHQILYMLSCHQFPEEGTNHSLVTWLNGEGRLST